MENEKKPAESTVNPEPITEHPVILFDGVCNFCNSSVQFIIRRDPAGRFRFAALQSDAARQLLTGRGIDTHELDSIVLIDNGRGYTESTAALRIARRLKGWPKLAAPLMIIPRPLRDEVYRWLARHRYRWFGKRESCMLPTPNVRQRFLDAEARLDS